MQAPASVGFQTGMLFGLTLSNGTDATNDIDIAAGSARNSTDVFTMILASAITKRLDATWAVGTNQGGLDTGSIANATYHVWLIRRSDTGVVDALFSTSASAPTMPANYDQKRRIGSIVRAGATILAFKQDGDRFRLATPVLDINATNPGTAAVTRTLASVPVGIVVWADVTCQSSNGTTNYYPVFISSLDETDVAASGTALTFAVGLSGGGVIGAVGSAVIYVKTNTSAQIRSRQQVSGASDTFAIATNGWIDTRGRLA